MTVEGIYGREIEASLNENGGSFKFGYDIDVNGAVASKNTINMDCGKFKLILLPVHTLCARNF